MHPLSRFIVHTFLYKILWTFFTPVNLKLQCFICLKLKGLEENFSSLYLFIVGHRMFVKSGPLAGSITLLLAISVIQFFKDELGFGLLLSMKELDKFSKIMSDCFNM